MLITPLAPPAASPTPDQHALDFAVPAALQARFADAAARARTDVAGFIAQHPAASSREFAQFVTSHIGAPVGPGADGDDVALSLAAIRTRDDAHNAEAVWVDGKGISDAWQGAVTALDQHAGPSQAAAGRALLDQGRTLGFDLSLQLKDNFRRLRPFQAHPDMFQLVPGMQHVGGFSYPSGHATHAFVSAGILAAIDPVQAASAFATAEQVAYSRVYGAAHFSSDVVAGAYLGSAVAAFLTHQH